VNRGKIKNYLEAAKPGIIELETLLSSIPAIAPESGGEGEWKKAEALDAWLRKRGLPPAEWHCAPDPRVPGGKRPNLVLTLPGREKRAAWIMSHLDVVPPGEASLWKTDPYLVTVDRVGDEPTRIIGRGVEDNQQGMTASIFAALAYHDLGILPERTVKLLFVADEEVGSAMGVRFLLRERTLFSKEDLILIPDGGAPDGSEIEIAEKNLLWLKVRTLGKQCHGSTPDAGRNAFLAACDAALRLHALEKSIFNGRDELFDPDRSTFSPTKKEANVPNVNTIPGEDVFYMDCRVLPRYPLDAVIEAMRKELSVVEEAHGVRIEIDPAQRVESRATSSVSPIVAALTDAVRRVYGVEARPIGIGGGTVGAYLRNAGFDCAVWSRLNDCAHQPNEYAIIDNIVGDARVMAELMGPGD
jgi:succinyl-diaminopimelate desuccinylase